MGDTIEADQEILVLESDKRMDIRPKTGVVKAILVKNKLSEHLMRA